MAELRRKRGASQATVGACKAKFGGINASDARPLRALRNIPPVEVAVKMRLETLAASRLSWPGLELSPRPGDLSPR